MFDDDLVRKLLVCIPGHPHTVYNSEWPAKGVSFYQNFLNAERYAKRFWTLEFP
jgi:hypothetical protein